MITEKKQQLEKQASDIVEAFNFDNVHAYMKVSKWKWHNGEDDGIPSVIQLKATATMLLREVINSNEESASCATGGFMAIKFPWGLSLNFVIERSY